MSATIDEQIECVKREIRMRERVYPKWVETRKMLAATAEAELARMRDVLATLEHVKAGAP